MDALVGFLAAAIDCVVYPILYVALFGMLVPGDSDAAFRLAFEAIVCSAVMLVIGGIWIYGKTTRKITLFLGVLAVPLSGLALLAAAAGFITLFGLSFIYIAPAVFVGFLFVVIAAIGIAFFFI